MILKDRTRHCSLLLIRITGSEDPIRKDDYFWYFKNFR